MCSTLNYSLDAFFHPKLEKGGHFVPLTTQKKIVQFSTIGCFVSSFQYSPPRYLVLDYNLGVAC